MSSKYSAVTLDLSAVRDRTAVTTTLNNTVRTVYAMLVPAAASVHFGASGEPIRLVQGKEYRPCPGETDGVFISNVASSGQLVLIISYEGGLIEIEGSDESGIGSAQVVWGKAAQAGSVNSGPLVQLRNPANSGKIIKLSRVSATSGTNGNIYLAFQRNIISNNGGGVLSTGSKRFLDRSLATANPMTVSDDAGISGLIAGSTFDNAFWTEYGLAAGAAMNFPPTSATFQLLVAGGINIPGEFLYTFGQEIRLYPGWGCAVQHGVNGAGVTMNVQLFGVEGGA